MIDDCDINYLITKFYQRIIILHCLDFLIPKTDMKVISIIVNSITKYAYKTKLIIIIYDTADKYYKFHNKLEFIKASN